MSGPRLTLNDWPDPKAEEITPVQPEPVDLSFPEEIMSGVAGDFARLYSNYLEVPVHFFYMGFLTCLGAALADRLTLASELEPQPRLYTVLLGDSAIVRKSTAVSQIVDFFWSTVESFPSSWGVNSAAGLQRFLQKDNRLILCFDEFKQLISKCKRENSVLLPCITTLFESNRFESRTKTEHVRLENAFLSLLAASTIETYENAWEPAFIDIGFLNRLFIVPGSGKRRFALPKKIPDSDKHLLKQRLGQLLGHVGTEGLELDLTPEARDLYESWYESRDTSMYDKRLGTYAMRFMSLLAVNELKREVDLETIEKVIALVEWQKKVRSVYDPIDAQGTVAAMEERIRRMLKTKGPRSIMDLKRDVNYSRYGIWVWRTSLTNMTRAGEIYWNKNTEQYASR